MKSFKIYLSIVIFSLSFMSCEVRTDSNSGKILPEQAKKIYGAKSAKSFAQDKTNKIILRILKFQNPFSFFNIKFSYVMLI